MVESVLHFFKIHREMILGNPAVVVEDMLGVAPESLNAVDMVFGLSVDHTLCVTDRMMLAEPLQGIVASEGIRVVDRSLPCASLDMGHELSRGYLLYHLGIHPAVSLQ